MDTGAWIDQFRKDVLNSEKNYFDELLKYSSLDEISYPNLLLKRIIWGNNKVNAHIKRLKEEKEEAINLLPKSPKFCNWLSKYPSLWNELRLLTHYCLKAIMNGEECPKFAINSLQEDKNMIEDKEFKDYWNEILDALTDKLDYQLSGTTKTPIKEEAKNASTKLDKVETSKTNRIENASNKNDKMVKNSVNDAPNNKFNHYNQEFQTLNEKSAEIRWKLEETKNMSKLFLRNFNKLNLAYLFLRSYNILNLSEFIRKNAKIEYSRPQKVYYNILYNYRIYQEKQKLVKRIIKQYKYKRRTRAMSNDDNENTIWTLTKKKIVQDKDKITNDKINIKCLLKTAISNNNINEILKLSIDKRIQLLNADELKEVGYFYAMKMIKEKEKEKEDKTNKIDEKVEEPKQINN